MYDEAKVPRQLPTLVITDGKTHMRYRKHIDSYFNVASVRELDGKILKVVDDLIDGFIDEGAVDLYKGFCLQVPLHLMCDLLGFPRADAPLLQRAAEASVRLAGGAGETEERRVALHKDSIDFHRYAQGHIRRVRTSPDATLLSAMIHTVPEDGIPMTDQELISMLQALNVGGNETTTNGLGNMFWIALADPAMFGILRADRSLVPKFAEEALRAECPVSALPRWAMQDTEIGGVAIPAGSTIQVNYSAVNRDPAQFPEPQRIDVERKSLRNHAAFGMGPHYCAGAILARSEMKVAMNRILDRMTSIRLETTSPPVFQPKLIVRSVTTLPIVFEKADDAVPC